MENTTSNPSFDPDLIYAIYKRVWRRRASEIEKNNVTNDAENDVGAGSSKRNRVPSGEAVQRAATIAEAEGAATVASTHFERILPQLLLDF
ncbi:hypothetical protein Leryth_019546 [Lithospermum erythrorhizon]|nr:hypothetical protein Leryth_019546 [Lithospermum erythrorhizon]